MKPGERPPASPSNDGRLLDGTLGSDPCIKIAALGLTILEARSSEAVVRAQGTQMQI